MKRIRIGNDIKVQVALGASAPELLKVAKVRIFAVASEPKKPEIPEGVLVMNPGCHHHHKHWHGEVVELAVAKPLVNEREEGEEGAASAVVAVWKAEQQRLGNWDIVVAAETPSGSKAAGDIVEAIRIVKHTEEEAEIGGGGEGAGEIIADKVVDLGEITLTVGGLSAYELAVAKGYKGTLEEWLKSLEGGGEVARGYTTWDKINALWYPSGIYTIGENDERETDSMLTHGVLIVYSDAGVHMAYQLLISQLVDPNADYYAHNDYEAARVWQRRYNIHKGGDANPPQGTWSRWALVADGLTDAPEDGKNYLRQDGEWVDVIGDTTGLEDVFGGSKVADALLEFVKILMEDEIGVIPTIQKAVSQTLEKTIECVEYNGGEARLVNNKGELIASIDAAVPTDDNYMGGSAGLMTADDKHILDNIDVSIGELNNLITPTKSDLVSAINEAYNHGGGGEVASIDVTSLLDGATISGSLAELARLKLYAQGAGGRISVEFIRSARYAYLCWDVADTYMPEDIDHGTITRGYVQVEEFGEGAGTVVKIKPDTIRTVRIGLTDGDIEDITNAIEGKVDKEEGKGLSSNDYTNADKAKLSELSTEVGKKYEKPSDGIPSTDLSTDLKASLDRADAIYDDYINAQNLM